MKIKIQERNTEILRMLERGAGYKEVAKRFNLSKASIEAIVKKDKAARNLAERGGRLLAEIRECDDLEKKWDMESLIEALFPNRRVRNALVGHYQWEKITEISLRDLMNLAVSEKNDSRPGHAVSPLLEIRYIGKKGFLAVLDALTYTDIGTTCNHEWEHRLARLQRCWRVKGNSKYSLSKPLTHVMEGAMSENKTFGMGIFAAIYGRRSIRKYTSKPVEQNSVNAGVKVPEFAGL